VPERRVLVIEDEVYNRLVLAHELSDWPLEIEWAGSGREAEQLIASRPFDLILMDWLLPDTEGGELLPRLRARSVGRCPPTLVVSAYATGEKETAALAAGAHRFLTKPIDGRALGNALGELLPGLTPRGSKTVMTLAAEAEASTVVDRALLSQALDSLSATWRADSSAATRQVHSLRGQARSLGNEDLGQVLADLEKALQEPTDEDCVEANLDAARILLNAAPIRPARQALDA
jgi:CheY-like chemotaxis protein